MRAETEVDVHARCTLFLSDFDKNYSVSINCSETNIKVHERLFSGSVIVVCEKIDRHDEANRQIFQTFTEEAHEASCRALYSSNSSNWH